MCLDMPRVFFQLRHPVCGKKVSSDIIRLFWGTCSDRNDVARSMMGHSSLRFNITNVGTNSAHKACNFLA